MDVIEAVGSRWHAATPHRRTGARRGARGTRRGRWAIVALLTLTGLTVAPHKAHADGITDLNVLASVQRWSIAYTLDPAYVERVILCESSGDVNAFNPSGASGVLQFKVDTFLELEARLDQDPTLAPGLSSFDPEYRGLWDADAQIHVFSWFLYHFGTIGVAQLWACA